ncbi:hypothetical protein XPA_007862 [Xanthoria parietina]
MSGRAWQVSSLCLALTGCACRACCDVITGKQMSCFGIHDGSHAVSKISDDQYEKRTADSRSLIIGIISCLGIILVCRIINFSLEDANLYAFPFHPSSQYHWRLRTRKVSATAD